MNIPSNLKYSKDHEWVRVEGDMAYIGITDFAQSELGEIVIVDIMPVGGEVSEVNPKLEDNPELVNSDPYGEGWMIKVKMTDPSEVGKLLDAEAYKALIA